MLARIEESYLTILRVAIVCVAGLALLVAAGGAIAGAVYFIKGLGTSAAASPAGGDLATFISEKKLAAVGEGAAAENNPSPALKETAASPTINKAAGALVSYLNKNKSLIKKVDSVRLLNSLRSDLPSGDEAAYDTSLDGLISELQASTGRPLSIDQVGQLLQWHHDRFRESSEELRRNAAGDASSGWNWILRAAQAFLLFTAIAFYFLLVRIERHLKLVRVQHQPHPFEYSGEDGAHVE